MNDGTIHATCEDFRASADIDLEMDQADDRADPTWRGQLEPFDVQRLEYLRRKLNKRWVYEKGWQSLES